MEAAAAQPFAKLTLYADGAALQAFSGPPYQVWWALSAGTHQFWAVGVTSSGEMAKSDVVAITVVK